MSGETVKLTGVPLLFSGCRTLEGLNLPLAGSRLTAFLGLPAWRAQGVPKVRDAKPVVGFDDDGGTGHVTPIV